MPRFVAPLPCNLSPPRRASNPRPKSSQSQSPIPFACWQPARSRSILNLMNLWPVRLGPPPGKNLISNDFGLYADVGSVAWIEGEGWRGGGGRGGRLCSFLTSIFGFLVFDTWVLMIGVDFVGGEVRWGSF